MNNKNKWINENKNKKIASKIPGNRFNEGNKRSLQWKL
jgi:hypothetical protein